MKYFLCFIFFTSFLFSCSGSCISCHPALDYKDDRHSPMLECTTCHQNEPSAESACGTDCFVCHDANKLSLTDKDHKSISSCIECHSSINKTPFVMMESKSLKSFLGK